MQARQQLGEFAAARTLAPDDGDVLAKVDLEGNAVEQARARIVRQRQVRDPQLAVFGKLGLADQSLQSGGEISSAVNCSATCWYLISASMRCWSQSISSFTGPGRSL